MIKNIGQGQGYFRLSSPQSRLESLTKVDVKSREAEDSILLRGDSVELHNQLTDASNDTSYAKELKERINLQKSNEEDLKHHTETPEYLISTTEFNFKISYEYPVRLAKVDKDINLLPTLEQCQKKIENIINQESSKNPLTTLNAFFPMISYLLDKGEEKIKNISKITHSLSFNLTEDENWNKNLVDLQNVVSSSEFLLREIKEPMKDLNFSKTFNYNKILNVYKYISKQCEIYTTCFKLDQYAKLFQEEIKNLDLKINELLLAEDPTKTLLDKKIEKGVSLNKNINS